MKKRGYVYYFVSAKTLWGTLCFHQGLTETEATELACEWRESHRADGDPIDTSSIAVQAYTL